MKLKLQPYDIRANISPDSYNATDNTIEVVFATEYQVERRSWDGTKYIEILDCTPSAVRMARLNAGANLVDSHNTYGIKSILGVVVKGWVENNECRAIIKLSERDDVKGYTEDIKAGIIRNISVGYQIYGATQIDNDNEVIQIRVTDWEPMELSVLSVPADYTSGTRSKDNNSNYYELNVSKKTNMTPEEIVQERKRVKEVTNAVRAAKIDDTSFLDDLIERGVSLDDANKAIISKLAERGTPAPAPVAAPAPTPAPNHNEGISQERTRVKEITSAVRSAKIDDVEFLDGLIERGVTIDKAREAIITKLGENQPEIRGHQSGKIKMGKDEVEKVRAVMENALEHRADPRVKLIEGASDFRGLSMLEMGRECLERAGTNTRGMSTRELAQRALGMNSTSDFPVILGNTVYRTLRKEYDLQTRTFTGWANQGVAKDFRNMTRTSLGEFDDFQEVKEGGEYEYGTVGEAGETYKVVKYGRKIAYTWEMMINDDLGALSRIPRKIASAAARKQSDLVYAILTGNPNMSDGVALFHANHGNLLAGAAIAIDPMGLMRKAMRNQKGIDKKDFLNLTPEFLICGPNYEQLALQYTSAQYTANVQGNINVWAGTVKPVIEPRITDNSWFFAASPNAIDTIEFSFLEGEGELFTEQRQGFDVDGVEIKARMVFGAKAIDFRGLNKNPGA